MGHKGRDEKEARSPLWEASPFVGAAEAPRLSQISPSSALQRNIDALRRRQEVEEAKASGEQRFADAITRFSGSMTSAYLHLCLFGGWALANLGAVPGLSPFDPSFVMLATIASVEAIFLSTFILISQNRASAAAERRANLNLQISLLSEREVTRLVRLTSAIAEHFGISAARDPELGELQNDIAPEAVLDALEGEEKKTGR